MSLSTDDVIQMQRFDAKIEQLATECLIPRSQLFLSVNPWKDMDNVVLRLVRRLAYMPGEERLVIPRIEQHRIVVPASWWDAFKEQHFDLLLRWFPVRYTVLQEQRVLQYEQAYEARQYLPNLELPDSIAGPVPFYRLQPLDKVID